MVIIMTFHANLHAGPHAQRLNMFFAEQVANHVLKDDHLKKKEKQPLNSPKQKHL